MSDSEHSSVSSNEGSDAEASEDDQQPTAAYGWGREPRYSAEELASRVVNVEEEDASAAASDMIEEEYAWPPVSRVGNTDWCECGQKCTAMPNRLECLCCQDAAVTVELVRRYDVSCITDLADYDIVILHRGVLSTALRGYFDMRKQPMPVTEEPDNRSLRYAAYRQYTLYVHGKLGKHVRCRIPACVVNTIRQRYPNPAGVPYQGFNEASEDIAQWPEN
ncbi:P2X purinoceptor 7-like [Sycon ciliatum]|uniref:P2X purinoceptor 7-like n=1 Tax=Sycon ciliatum TaxID=27933 RepID=UPI0031F711F5